MIISCHRLPFMSFILLVFTIPGGHLPTLSAYTRKGTKLDLFVKFIELPFLAEDCLLQRFYEGPLTRKLTLKLDESAAIYDPTETLHSCWSIAFMTPTPGSAAAR